MAAKYTKEMLQDAVKQSASVFGVLRYLGISTNSGGMHSHISNRIKKLGIDTSHFLGIKTNSGKNHKCGYKKLTASEILIFKKDGRREKRYRLCRALVEIGIKEECKECGLETEWNNKPLTLHIDHISGNNLDNRRENLRFLCPNCHAQTPTYGKIKSAKQHRKCKKCNIKIYQRSKTGYCHKCMHSARVAQLEEA